MTEPSWSFSSSDAAYVADVFDEFNQQTSDGTTGWLALVRTAVTTMADGSQNIRSAGVLTEMTRALAAVVSRDQLRRAFEPVIRQMAIALGIDNASTMALGNVWRELYDAMHANSYSFNRQTDTYANFSADGSNVGDTVVERLTVDEHGYPLTGWIADDYTITCVKDGSTPGVKPFREVWDLTSTVRPPTNLEEGGAGLRSRGLRCLTEEQTKAWVANPSFRRYTQPSSTLTALPGWRAGSGTIGTNFAISTSNTYRQAPGDDQAQVLVCSADDSLYPDVANGGKYPKFDEDTPYTYRIKVRRNSTSTGTVTIRLSSTIGSGGVSASLSLASLSADTWGTLKIAIGSNSWPANFGTANVLPQIEFASISGSCSIGNVVLGPLIRVGARASLTKGRGGMGQYVFIGDGQTPAARGDFFTASDTQATRAVCVEWMMVRTEFGYLPHSATPTIADR